MTRTVKAVGGVVVAVALVLLLAYTYLASDGTDSPGAEARGASPSSCAPAAAGSDGLTWVCLSELPDEAQQTVALIEAGGPFPYAKDGSTFNNFEGLLPTKSRGYYREYTVKTPGESDRGARRIVSGDRDRELFYTADHYETFARVQR